MGGTLCAGVTLGHYRVLDKIGAGGMGEVYRARDTQLDREVAIKTIASAVDPTSDAFSRFRREARLLAQLNHPHIATIHDFVHADGIHFLVLELVSGESLDRQLEAGPLPVEQALRLGVQIAEALEASHARGVIHRDLKPANVKVTAEGQVKVLDFGLAKAFDFGPPAAEPTITSNESRTQGILGTGPYMSPEQARGQELDKRTDIWSFGCVLYEMLSGRRAFGGDTLSDSIACVLQSEPDWDALAPDTPATLVGLMRRCLRKDVERRLRDAGDARIELEEAFESLANTDDGQLGSTRRHRRVPFGTSFALAAGLALIAAVAAYVVGWGSGRRATATAPPPQTTVTHLLIGGPQPGWRIQPTDGPSIALSPDGRRLVFAARSGPQQQFFLRQTHLLESLPIAGTQSANGVFVAPDGEWMGYFVVGAMVKISMQGGKRLFVGPAGLPRGASWGYDGSIIYAPIPEAGLERVPAGGGRPTSLTRPDRSRGERTHRWPHALPDGKTVLFTVGTSDIATFDEARIDALDLASGERHSVLERGSYPIYSPSGHLLFISQGTLMAVPFDLQSLQTTGDAVDVIQDVLSYPYSGGAQVAFSPQGTLAYLEGKPHVPAWSIVTIDAADEPSTVDGTLRAFNTLAVSPDGTRLATDIDGACAQIYVHDLERGGTPTRLTLEWSNTRPVWTPDGTKITFASDRRGLGDIYWKSVDLGGEPELLISSDNKKWPHSWSPDGRALAYVEQTSDMRTDIWVFERGSDRPPRPFVATSFAENQPTFSPDGRWIAYASGEALTTQIYVKPYPDDGRRWTISTQGGRSPRWSPDGSMLYFTNRGKLYGVAVRPGPEFGLPEPLHDMRGLALEFDVAPDGRIFTLKSDDRSVEPRLHLVVNWIVELRERVPSGDQQ